MRNEISTETVFDLSRLGNLSLRLGRDRDMDRLIVHGGLGAYSTQWVDPSSDYNKSVICASEFICLESKAKQEGGPRVVCRRSNSNACRADRAAGDNDRKRRLV